MTDGTVFDRLHQWFGVGDYDGVKPWHQFRMVEVGKIRRTREKRGVTIADLLLAIDYCRANNIVPLHHWDLYEHILPAVKWNRRRETVKDAADLEELIAEAIAIEGANPDSLWTGRLIRAAGPAREEVYEEWATWSTSR